ncbi:MAG: hypothetical protein WKF75_06255 [Singulisphaera sp.]
MAELKALETCWGNWPEVDQSTEGTSQSLSSSPTGSSGGRSLVDRAAKPYGPTAGVGLILASARPPTASSGRSGNAVAAVGLARVEGLPMVPFHPLMYPDDVVFFRHLPITGSQGASRRTFPTPSIPLKAFVSSKGVDRTDARAASRPSPCIPSARPRTRKPRPTTSSSGLAAR